MDAEVSTHTFLTMIIEESVCFMSCEPFFFAIILMWYTRNIYIFINWTLRMSDNIPEIVQILGHAHIICITVLENRIICCQLFCDLLLKSAFERIFNVMQLILVKIRWHIKWKYLIQKFHDICLSYYFNWNVKNSNSCSFSKRHFHNELIFKNFQYQMNNKLSAYKKQKHPFLNLRISYLETIQLPKSIPTFILCRESLS